MVWRIIAVGMASFCFFDRPPLLSIINALTDCSLVGTMCLPLHDFSFNKKIDFVCHCWCFKFTQYFK